MKVFSDRLCEAIKEKGNPVCVGLDPRIANLPDCFEHSLNSPAAIASAYESFCKTIIDIVAEHVPVVKPQTAFFEELGAVGFQAMENVVKAAHDSGLLVVMDAKRGDIGSTAIAYANGFLNRKSSLFSDALTVNPYLGDDSIDPFIEVAEENGAGIFVLAKTSNPGGKLFQDLQTLPNQRTIYQHVSNFIQERALSTRGESGFGLVGAVVGATYPEQLAELRAEMPNAIFLIPGFGAQGGTVDDIKHGFNADGLGAIVNSSRGIIFAYENPEFEADSWERSIENSTRKMIEELRPLVRR